MGNRKDSLTLTMVKGEDYVEKGLTHCMEQVRQSKEAALIKLARELGRKLVPVT